MAFKAVYMANAPDADKEKHRSVIDTGKLQLFTVIVKNLDEALSVAKEMYQKENVSVITLCPGFTHKDVSAIFDALQGKVGVTVARGDGPTNQITQAVRQKEFGF